MMDMHRRAGAFASMIALVLGFVATPSRAQDLNLSPPSDDRWHYPFNGTPGTRANGSNFTSDPAGSFDYRDAMIDLRFRPNTTVPTGPDYVRPGLAPERYEFTGAKVVMYHRNALAYTWDTNSLTTDTAGNPFQLQIFGMGNNDALTMTHPTLPFNLETWVQASPYFGKLPGPGATERSPYPLNLNPLAVQQNVTNVTNATPWGLGQPVYGTGAGEYTPGTIPSAPFPVTYTLDVSNPRVKEYIQKSLSKGRVDWVLSATVSPPGPGPQLVVPDFILKENVLNLPPRFILEGFNVCEMETITLDSPSDDRWHYAFNGTPGTRPQGPIFTANPADGFNYRDAVDIFRFRPNTVDPQDPEYIEPGLAPNLYEIATAKLTVYSPVSAGGLAFTWDTRDAITTDSMGNLPMIQLFGMGNDDALTSGHPTQPFMLDTWTETKPFFGAAPFPGSSERSPYPLNIDDTAAQQNVADEVNATPWALGHPVYGTGAGEYTPGVIAVEPFPITFTLDLTNDRIREYIQQGLSQGYIDWVIAGTFGSSMGGGTQYPQIILKESALNRPAKLELEFCAPPPPPSAAGGWEMYD